MNLVELFQKYVTFSNVMDIIKLVSLIVGAYVIIKQRADLIVAKYKQKKAEEINNATEVRLARIEQRDTWVMNTLLAIVQASKLDTKDKVNITKEFTQLHVDLATHPEPKEVTPTPTVLETLEDVKDTVDTIGGILDI